MFKEPPKETKFYPIRITHRDQLWELALRSKAHWKYPVQYLEAARDGLKLSALQIGQGWGEIAATPGQWLGYYFILPSFSHCQLEHLWVEPDWIGKGVGGKLLEQAIQSVKNAGFHDTIQVYSDPDAEGFYLKYGFKRVGEVPSKVENGPMFPSLVLKV
ncbi:MAG: GNAT family N-acetyltransferase [Bdellovibrionales bacterium]|nr:GNAT family N-acetyltransferase [Bdellovibrionales bacterium]